MSGAAEGAPAREPVEIRAPEGARLLEIVWDDGTTTAYEHRVLRGLCPCAYCQGHSGPTKWVEGTEALPEAALELRGLKQVGAYALGLTWGDGHASGIYTFRFLTELGALYGRDLDEVRELTFHR
jgi:DUF971 family protein